MGPNAQLHYNRILAKNITRFRCIFMQYMYVSTHIFMDCSNFKNIAYQDYCFESRIFNIMRQLNIEISTNAVEAFCL